MRYKEFLVEREQAINSFNGKFYAYTKKELHDKMKERGLDYNDSADRDKLVFVPFNTYVFKDRKEEWDELNKRLNGDLNTLMNDKKFLIDALVYELKKNHCEDDYDPTPALASLHLLENKNEEKEKTIRAVIDGYFEQIDLSIECLGVQGNFGYYD